MQCFTAGWEGGNELLAYCEEENPGVWTGMCSGYIEGVMDASGTLQNWKGFKPNFCIPNGVTLGQVQAIVVKFLKENPELRHHTASGAVLNALFDAFPAELKQEDGELVYYCP